MLVIDWLFSLVIPGCDLGQGCQVYGECGRCVDNSYHVCVGTCGMFARCFYGRYYIQTCSKNQRYDATTRQCVAATCNDNIVLSVRKHRPKLPGFALSMRTPATVLGRVPGNRFSTNTLPRSSNPGLLGRRRGQRWLSRRARRLQQAPRVVWKTGSVSNRIAQRSYETNNFSDRLNEYACQAWVLQTGYKLNSLLSYASCLMTLLELFENILYISNVPYMWMIEVDLQPSIVLPRSVDYTWHAIWKSHRRVNFVVVCFWWGLLVGSSAMSRYPTVE